MEENLQMKDRNEDQGRKKIWGFKKKLEKIEKLTDHDRGNKLSGSGSRIILTRKKIGLGSPVNN